MGGGVYSGDAGAQDWEKHLAELLGCLALAVIGGVETLREIQERNKQKPPQKQRKKSIDRDSR